MDKSFQHVVCQSPVECQWKGKPRTVQMQYLGQGLYLKGDIVCECGFMPLFVDPEGDEIHEQAISLADARD